VGKKNAHLLRIIAVTFKISFMTKKMNLMSGDFSQKVNDLKNAKKKLKNQFIGIDDIIDSLIDNVRSWYTMNIIQEKPAVINLWGLTGVGKTSLVKKLMELLKFDDKTYRIDLGEKHGETSFTGKMKELCKVRDNNPKVIMLDEFQHARTITGPFREENIFEENRKIWELIDEGVVNYNSMNRGFAHFEQQMGRLERLIGFGVKVKNGFVVEGKDLHVSEMGGFSGKDEPLFFFPLNDYQLIIDLAGQELNIELQRDLARKLMKMNEIETMSFLKKVHSIAKRPKVKCFKRSIIFVLGNLDEAFTMSGNYSPDMSADEFHRITKKITVTEIKKALRERFRDEQIGRLGNIHIIYPALSINSYRKIIRKNLNEIGKRLKQLTGLNLKYNESVIDAIYQEGVYPALGTRPIFSTINQMIKSKLSVYVDYILNKKLKADTLFLCMEDEKLKCQIISKKELMDEVKEKVVFELRKLKEPKKDEKQAISAVHEAGHAVACQVLFNTVPDVVASVTASPENDGFVYVRPVNEYVSKKDVIPHVAMLLAGITAEELVFGEDHITSGSSSDISSATIFVTSLLKKHGFGKTKIAIADSVTESSKFYHKSEDVEEHVREIMNEAKALAKNTLIKEKPFLIELASYLSVQPRIEKDQLLKMSKKHSISNRRRGEGGTFYRDKLKNEARIILNKKNFNNQITHLVDIAQ
tara:strand:+ start:7710 stop:9803 length:2094 start_codon:yes stop_codon:yes gene_type:complete